MIKLQIISEMIKNEKLYFMKMYRNHDTINFIQSVQQSNFEFKTFDTYLETINSSLKKEKKGSFSKFWF